MPYSYAVTALTALLLAAPVFGIGYLFRFLGGPFFVFAFLGTAVVFLGDIFTRGESECTDCVSDLQEAPFMLVTLISVFIGLWAQARAACAQRHACQSPAERLVCATLRDAECASLRHRRRRV